MPATPPQGVQVVIVTDDAYRDDRPAGAVVGSRCMTGALRRGADAERVLAIDNGALRIGFMERPGWGRHGIVYGPHSRRDGLALATVVLNGHNGSQTAEAGAGSATFLRRQLWRVRYEVRSRLQRSAGRRAPRWLRRERRPNHYFWPPVLESLAVGWFAREAPARPERNGHAFVMRGAGAECGELCAVVEGRLLPVLHGVQNLPIYYLAVLREQGAVYYVGGQPGAGGLPGYPHLRPVAVDAGRGARRLYAGVAQGILGEIGFRADTRVRRTLVAEVPAWIERASSHAADELTGRGWLEEASARSGGGWFRCAGAFRRGPEGAISGRGESRAVLMPDAPSGLLHVMLDVPGSEGRGGGLVWRAEGASFWGVMVERRGARLIHVEQGLRTEVAFDRRASAGSSECSLQVLDDGRRFQVALDGRVLFGGGIEDARLSEARGVGLLAQGSGVRFRAFEAHPRRVDAPPLGLEVPWAPSGSVLVVRESFDGPPRDLHGKISTFGGIRWCREQGDGAIDTTGCSEAKVRADRRRPNPGRTLYTLSWPDPHLADLSVEIVPPGSRQGEGELCRGGLVLWQDPENYIVINEWNDDRFAGASVSSFFVARGAENLFDAVWTNVGQRIRRRVPHVLRVISDGNRFTAYVDGEPVLHRALTDVYPGARPLRLTRVGLAVNWEFGDDTGTVFRRFVARAGMGWPGGPNGAGSTELRESDGGGVAERRERSR